MQTKRDSNHELAELKSPVSPIRVLGIMLNKLGLCSEKSNLKPKKFWLLCCMDTESWCQQGHQSAAKQTRQNKARNFNFFNKGGLETLNRDDRRLDDTGTGAMWLTTSIVGDVRVPIYYINR